MVCIVGDNCLVNRAIGNRKGPPSLVGCASHRFYLACDLFLDEHFVLVGEINDFMKKPATIKGRAMLRRAK